MKMKLHQLLDRFDHWLHPLYFWSLFIEGHGFYALVGGGLGGVTLLLAFIEEHDHLKGGADAPKAEP